MQIYTITYKNPIGEVKEIKCTALTIEYCKNVILIERGGICSIKLDHYTENKLYSTKEYKKIRKEFLEGRITKDKYKEYKNTLELKLKEAESSKIN